jgi:hypothetical protein
VNQAESRLGAHKEGLQNELRSGRQDLNLRLQLVQVVTPIAVAKTANGAALQMRCKQVASNGSKWRWLTPICGG